MQVGFRDFNVIPKDLIEANLQRADVGAFTLALFHGGDNLFAVLAEVAKFIELGVVTAADHSRIAGQGGWLVGDGAFEPVADVGELVDFLVEVTKKFAAASGRRRQKILQHRKLCERLAQRHELARSRKTQRDAAGEPLEVEDALELLADFSADDGLLDEVRDGIEARLDAVAIDERPENPGTQETRAHAGHRGVQHSNESGGAARAAGFLGEERREQLQIADGNGIEHESVVLLVVAHAVEMPQGFGAGGINVFIGGGRAVTASGVFAEIVYDGAGRSERLRVIVKAESREFGDAKLFAQDARGIVALKDPIFEAGFHAANTFQERWYCRFEKLLRPGKQSLPRAEQLEFVAKSILGACA